MKQLVEEYMIHFVKEFDQKNNKENIWGMPVVKFGNATLKEFKMLREVVHPEHYNPDEILACAKTVISYFIPYNEKIGESNIEGELNSKEWAMTYERTRELVRELEDGLTKFVQEKGYHVQRIDDAKALDKEVLKSRWSHRHVAYICGLGTFGINNMLITEKGCCGRIGSMVSDIDVHPDLPIETEYCLKKKNGTCGTCIERCPAKALNIIKSNINLCKQQCDKNRVVYNNINTCGKCVVGLPCTFKKP